MNEDILSLEQAAELLKMSARSLGDLAVKGKIPATRLLQNKWIFSRNQLIQFVESLSIDNVEPVELAPAEVVQKKTPLNRRRRNVF